MNAMTIAPHFSDPVHQAQQTFRSLLTALSRPGTIVALPSPASPPAPFGGAVAATALTLFDFDTPVWLDQAFTTDNVRRYLHYHCGARCVAEPRASTFAVIGSPNTMPPLSEFAWGTASDPDRSATLIVQIPSLSAGPVVTLTGPGIEDSTSISPAGLPQWFWLALRENAVRYPLGVDVFLADSRAVIGLPRTTRVMI